MKLHACFLLFLSSFFSFAQKNYSFDYKIVYNHRLNDALKFKEVSFCTNSKDNSYFLIISDKDSLNYELTFKDHNGTSFLVISEKTKVDSVDKFLLDCQWVIPNANLYKHQTKNYSFHKEKAMIDGEYYPLYVLKSDDLKREKRKNISRFYYSVENNTEFHLPILAHETAYEEWKLEKNIMNGIAKEMYFKTVGKTDLYDFYKLKEVIKIDKTIVIPKECDYTDPNTPKKIYIR